MKLSIISICYNDKDGLNDTGLSIVKQSYRDFEWIIIDGGSHDGSKELIESFNDNPAANLTFWCSEKDKGIYNAMNKGIVQSKGDYLLFLNSGDYLADENALTTVFNEDHSEDLLVGYIYRKKRNGELYVDKGFDTSNITIRHLLRNSLPHQATFIRHDLFEKCGMYDEDLKVVADWKFFMQCIILHNCSIKNLQVPVTVYEAGGISDNPNSGGTAEWNRTLAELLPERVISDFHFIRSCEDVCSISLGRVLFKALYRLVMFIKY